MQTVTDESIEQLERLRRAIGEEYEIGFPLSSGGQGRVYGGLHRRTSRVVAIKVMRGDDSRRRLRFDREIELSSRLDHPGIVRITDAGVADDVPYYVMDYVEGGVSIADHVSVNNLEPREIVLLFAEACRAVHHAHQRGVIHRDLSHSNVLVGDDDQPHILDFGLARDARSDIDVTGDAIVGTPPYLSPEQLGFGDATADVRSDVYSLGILLYKLLSDDYPYSFSGEIFQDRDRVLFELPRPLRIALLNTGRTVDRDLETITAMATAKEKARRYQSAGDFADDLDRWIRGEAVVARGDSRLYLLRKTLRKHRAVAFTAVTCLALLCIFWFQVLNQRNNARESTAIAYQMFERAYSVEDAVASLPGGLAIREQFIEGLRADMATLRTKVEEDSAFLPIYSQLLEMQGDLAAERGDEQAAKTHLRAFIATSLDLANRQPGNVIYANQVTRAYRKAAEASRSVGLFAQGGLWGRRTLDLFPGNEQVKFELCRLYLSAGEYFSWANDHAAAIKRLDEAARLCIDAPNSRQWQSLRAKINGRRGGSLLALGRGEEGLMELCRSLEIRQIIASENINDVETSVDLMTAHAQMAAAQRDLGQIAEACTNYERAIELGESLRRLDPERVEVGFSLYACYDRLAYICWHNDDIGAAQKLCDSAVILAEELAGTSDRKADGLSTLAYARSLAGELALAQGDPEEAYDAFLKAATILGGQLDKSPDDVVCKKRVADVQSWLGKASRKSGNISTAIGHYSTARELYSDLYEGSVQGALSIVRSLINLAAAHLDNKTSDGDIIAAQLLDQAKRVLDEERAGGRLKGHSQEVESIDAAIAANSRIISNR